MTDSIEYLKQVNWQNVRTVAIEIVAESEAEEIDPVLMLYKVAEFEKKLPTYLTIVSRMEHIIQNKVKYMLIISNTKDPRWTIKNSKELKC